jgi:hypothetical protein
MAVRVGKRRTDWWAINKLPVLVLLVFGLTAGFVSSQLRAQQYRIVSVRPDIAAPGMTVVIEVLAKADPIGAFGPDSLGLAVARFVHPVDSSRVLFGPVQVSWSGRLAQIPIFIVPDAAPGVIPFFISSTTGKDTSSFTIAKPQHLPVLSGNITMGNAPYDTLSHGNTIIVDSLIAQNAAITFTLQNPNSADTENPRLQPVIILSRGPVRLTNSTISVSAQGLDGGPGGGGGGHGNQGIGGAGYTGGGNGNDSAISNAGSGSLASSIAGGSSITGILGGGSVTDDQGGGGGTGAPFGSSGSGGIGNDTSRAGGFGGGSGGGEATPTSPPNPQEYGGGGGAFGTNGDQGEGIGQNQGVENGGRFLIPLAGGSGGASGNSLNETFGAGSGGGGGGAVAIVSFDSVSIAQSRLLAQGDSGTSGVPNTAGGGGGSGGGIYLASTLGISATDANIQTDGGRGGRGGLSQGAGGSGGLGRIRTDGPFDSCIACLNSGVTSNGISIFPIFQRQVHGYAQVMGVASDTNNTLDNIRIYYRTRHTGWEFADTVRYRSGGKTIWSKWLPLSHDSLLFVIAMVKVENPSTDNANLEPGWIMSDVGMTVVHHVPSPFLVTSNTLNFGDVRINHCEARWLKISNEGELPLIIDSLILSGSHAITYLTPLPITIPGYSNDSIEVQFCPDTLGIARTAFTILSNDSTKIVSLIGNGMERKDSLSIVPPRVNFARVLVGHCASDTVMLYSIGTDTVYLDSSRFNLSPFTIEILNHDTSLAPHDSARLVITFCPSDTGTVHIAPAIDTRGDSIIATGRGVLRMLQSKRVADLGEVCANASIEFIDTITNVGNDTVTIHSASLLPEGATLISPTLPVIVQPKSAVAFTWRWNATSLGSQVDTAFYSSPDTSLRTIVSYNSVRPELGIDSSLEFHFLCVNDSEFATLDIRNLSTDSIHIRNLQLQHGIDFSLRDSISTIAPDSSAQISIRFRPSSANRSTDSIFLTASVAQCESDYVVAIGGSGSVEQLATESLNFDTVLVEECKVDSLLVQNPCGPDITIDSIVISDSAFQFTTPSLPLHILSHGETELYFRYCPNHAVFSDDTIRLIDNFGNTYRTVLRGNGKSVSMPWAHFTLTGANIIAGDSESTLLELDSTSLVGVHTFTSTISYDPSVVFFLGGSIPLSSSLPGAVTFSGTLNFSQSPQTIASMRWLGLLGGQPSTKLNLAFSSDDALNAIVKTGLITIIDCSDLGGHVSVSGAYHLGQINPDPVLNQAKVQIEIGQDGYVDAAIYDVTGRLERQVIARALGRGTYGIDLPVSTLGSGRHFFVVRSLGWSAIEPFLLLR